MRFNNMAACAKVWNKDCSIFPVYWEKRLSFFVGNTANLRLPTGTESRTALPADAHCWTPLSSGRAAAVRFTEPRPIGFSPVVVPRQSHSGVFWTYDFHR